MDHNRIKTAICPDEYVLNDYLNKGLATRRNRIRRYPRSVGTPQVTEVEAHVAHCPYCLYKIAEAYDILKDTRKFNITEVFMAFFKKINLWLTISILMFALSFCFPRHFIQFLAGSMLCGIKWILDNKNTRMLIMIHDAWRHGGEREAGQVIESLGSKMRR